jgi:hypothetical protein
MQRRRRRSKITKSSGFDALYSERELIYIESNGVHWGGGATLNQLTAFASFVNSLHFAFAH